MPIKTLIKAKYFYLALPYWMWGIRTAIVSLPQKVAPHGWNICIECEEPYPQPHIMSMFRDRLLCHNCVQKNEGKAEMNNRSLEELKKEGKKTLQELEEQIRKEQEERSRQIVSMIAEMERVAFDELWGIFKDRRGAKLEFSIPQYAPIYYTYYTNKRDKIHNGWKVWTGTCSYFKHARNLGEALVIAKRAFEKRPREFEKTVVNNDSV